MSQEAAQIVFINEEYTYLCLVVILDGSTTHDQIREWWQTKKGDWSEPLPGESSRDRILWAKNLNPESGWTPTEDTWPCVGDVFHLYDPEANTYDPTEYVMGERCIFIHTHMDDDSFLRFPGEDDIPHPDADPEDDTEETPNPASMMAWGITTSQTPHFHTFNKQTPEG